MAAAAPYSPIATPSTAKSYTRYVQGGVTDVFRTRLGWWERQIIATDVSDFPFTLGFKHANAADLIAFEIYGKEAYEWLVLQFNNIVDPLYELVPGAVIMLPQPARVFTSILNKPTGGNPVNINNQ